MTGFNYKFYTKRKGKNYLKRGEIYYFYFMTRKLPLLKQMIHLRRNSWHDKYGVLNNGLH